MTHRILPRHEWPRLRGTPLGDAFRGLALMPSDETPFKDLNDVGLTVMVVEDEKGRIRGHWSDFVALHAEQVWVHPEERKQAVVIRHLLSAQAEFAATLGATHYITHAATPEVERLLVGHDGVKGLGAARLPGDPYRVPAVKGA